MANTTGVNQIFSSRNEKYHLHSFFGGGRIRDGSGTRGYGAFFLFEKGAGTPMGRGSRDFFAVSNGFRSLPETKWTSLQSPFPSLTPWFEHSFCTSFRLLNEEAVCTCF
jgi:hypothetical protein